MNIYSQKSVNDYKYVVVPERFGFFNDKDAYQLNSMTKFLFNKYGFNALMNTDEFPEDLKDNGCKKLLADVVKGNGLFVTKLAIQLTDCNGIVVYTSPEGTSREKEYRKGFQEALRNAFKNVARLNYKYNEANETSEDVKSVPSDKKPETSKEKKPEVVVPSENTLDFTWNNKTYVFKKQEYGYELLSKQEETLLSEGKIYKMSKDNSYLVDANDLSGAGYFDGYGNFILERINPATNKLITDTLARQ
ncbi:hypothetical protein [Aquimarina mytili]|uniref:Uncharacterized protein n=1 Tax=Aquimarina mytili TaxID=874423 RepID=A0A937DAV1_9FLAO|nr:hypothetical protein [Aquimarina mytili]MBL0685122.1 hypothetical protein [Aquimarina mytili]